jgi:hypothetical protein
VGFLSSCFGLVAGHASVADSFRDPNEILWVHRNLGAAYLDEGLFEQAAAELARAAETAPQSAGDARNAAIAALLAADVAAARAELDRAEALDPQAPATFYARGILEKRAGQAETARAALLRCRELGGTGPELDYALGVIAQRLGDQEAAEREFAKVVALGADHAPRHFASALYRHGRVLITLGRRDEGTAALQRYQTLAKSGGGTDISEEDLDRGNLLALATFPRPSDVRAAGAMPAFAPSALALAEIRWAEAADLDGDGDTDLLAGDGQTLHDLRRSGDEWTDVTASRGLAGLLGVAMARSLDLDNDGRTDLVRGGGSGLVFHAGQEGAWEPPRVLGVEPISRFIPVDYDHEGDVDLAAAGSRRASLVRNLGDRTFADVSEESGLAAIGPCVTLASCDLDDDQDVDLVFVTRRGEVVLASNQREGKFQISPVAGVPAGTFDVACGDLDHDGDVDLAVAAPRGVFVLENRGGLQFAAPRDPVLEGTIRWPAAGAQSLWIEDFDADGRLDLLAAAETGGLLGLNAGNGSFAASPEALRLVTGCGAYPVAVAIVDDDERMDLITSRGSCGLARNVGRGGAAVVLRLAGKGNNHDGVGAVVEMLSGARYIRRDATGSPVHLGLGQESRCDAVRVRWPNGIQQAVVGVKADTTIVVTEKEGLVGSCPFLYTWNGGAFEFVTDILTVTPLGLPVRPGQYVPPNWDEAIRIPSASLAPDAQGFLTLQVTEELREVTYLDQVRLYAIDHPETVEVQPNEKFKFPPFPEFAVHVLDGARPPLRATDWRGRDVTGRLLDVDDLVVGDLPLTRYQGITEMHSLELDFGDVPPDAPLTLHLAGWFYWTNASVNLAIAQDPRHEFIPPQIEIAEGDGRWTAWPNEVGFPGGKTKSIPVNLTGAFPSGHARLRILTSLRLYWDRALLQVGASPVAPHTTMLLPDSADLHVRGHSKPIFSESGEEPERFDYAVMRDDDVPWDPHPGAYTRVGDVTPLVQLPDDMYAIMATGDECSVRFRADRLPALPPGWIRTYLAVFDGWAKDGDVNTTHGGQVEPLPFHTMSGYPYPSSEQYPDDENHRAYRAEWNTRTVGRWTRDLLAESRAGTVAPAPTLAPAPAPSGP